MCIATRGKIHRLLSTNRICNSSVPANQSHSLDDCGPVQQPPRPIRRGEGHGCGGVEGGTAQLEVLVRCWSRPDGVVYPVTSGCKEIMVLCPVRYHWCLLVVRDNPLIWRSGDSVQCMLVLLTGGPEPTIAVKWDVFVSCVVIGSALNLRTLCTNEY